MAAPRRFDHDEARRRYAAGERVSDLAREYGVTDKAIYLVVSDRCAASHERARANYYARRRVPCEACGKQCLDAAAISSKRLHNPDGRSLCRRCRSDEKLERLRFDLATNALFAVRCSMVDCANGERWQSPDNFTRGVRHRDIREGGIHSVCRACQTRMRTRNRALNRERDRAYDRNRKRRLRSAA